MKTEDKLLDFLNRKVSEYEADLPDKDWHDFEEKFYQSNKKPNRIIIFSLSSILVLLLALFLFSNSRQNIPQKEETGLNTLQQSYSHRDYPDAHLHPSKFTFIEEIYPPDGSENMMKSETIPGKQRSLFHPDAQRQNGEAPFTARESHNPVEADLAVQSSDLLNVRATDAKQEPVNKKNMETAQETASGDSNNRVEENLTENYPIPLQSETHDPWSPALSLDIDLQSDTVFTEEENQAFTEMLPEEKTEKNNRSIPVMGRQKFVLELNLSSAWSDLKEDVSASNTPKIHEDYEIIHGKALEGAMAYALGVNISYFFTPAISLKSGFFYDAYKSGGLYNYVNDKTPVRDAEGNIIAYIPKGPDFIEYVYEDTRSTFSYIQMPLILGIHQMLNSRLRLDLHGGLSLMFLIDATGKSLSHDDLSLKNLRDFHPDRFNYGLILGLGSSFLWRENIILSLEPTYKQSLSSVYGTQNPVEVRPYAFGLKLGMNWIIK
jgi:hypothetical protein